MPKVMLENLSQDTVNIVISTLESTEDKEKETSHWRVALQNSIIGREQLAEVLAPYPDYLSRVLEVWGGTATVATPEPGPPPKMPDDGVYWLTDTQMPHTMAEMTAYLSIYPVDESDVLQGTHHINDLRVIPVLLQMIQDLRDRVDALEGQHADI